MFLGGIPVEFERPTTQTGLLIGEQQNTNIRIRADNGRDITPLGDHAGALFTGLHHSATLFGCHPRAHIHIRRDVLNREGYTRLANLEGDL